MGIYIYMYNICTHEKHPWTSDAFTKIFLLKVTLLSMGVFHITIYFSFFILLYSFMIMKQKS